MSTVGVTPIVVPLSDSPPPPIPTGPRPDSSELWSLAETLGIELPQEKHLLHIVRNAIKAPLPTHWSQHTTPDGMHYYFNSKSKQSRWLRPITPANQEAIRLARIQGPPTTTTALTNNPNTHIRGSSAGSILTLAAPTNAAAALPPRPTSQSAASSTRSSPRASTSSLTTTSSSATSSSSTSGRSATLGGGSSFGSVASIALAAAAARKAKAASQEGFSCQLIEQI
jgi:hypothetical protein